MVMAAFFISTAFILVALGAIQAGRRAAAEKERQALEDEVKTFLEHSRVPDGEHAEGMWQGMPVRLVLGHDEIAYEVKLTPAVIPYTDLLAKFGQGLSHELDVLRMHIDHNDTLRGSVAREVGLGENLVSIENRLPTVGQVRDLRRFAPGELVKRIDEAHASRDVDAILIELGKHFPDSPEVEEAIERAAAREHVDADRVRERAQGWIVRGQVGA